MRIFPAIDLRDGKVVRLLKGDYDKMTVYGDNPLEIAKEFENAGAEYLHVVDLDGAKDGDTPNFEAVREIIEGTNLKVEIGGGIRTEKVIKKYSEAGALRVIIGTMAIQNPEFTAEMIEKYGDKIAVGVDIAGGMVAIHGWTEITDTSVDDIFKKLIAENVQTIICTDISKDGAMQGTNVELYEKLVKNYGGSLEIVASGGVSTDEDLKKLSGLGVRSAIIGKALYTGAIDLKEAINKYQI